TDGATFGFGQTSAPTCYTCTDTRPNRCTGSVAVACTSTCGSSSNADPYSGNPAHTGNVCKAGTGFDCLANDTLVSCCVHAVDTGAGAVLVDVCSYPSSNPNSDPSDCV